MLRSLTLSSLIVLLLPAVISCSAQPAAKTKTPAARPKLVRTQGTGPYANIYCGLADRSGNLWFGTMGEGVYRYDGRSFVQLTTENGLCNNYVSSIIEDASGNIWFGTAYGVCKYDGNAFTNVPIIIRNGDLSTYTLPSGTFRLSMYGTPPPENTVWSMMQDKKGTLWFGTATGIYCYNGTAFTRFPGNTGIDNKSNAHLKMIDCMLEDGNGNTWLCSGMMPGNEGIIRYDGSALTRFKPYGEGWIRKVTRCRDGTLYFVTRSHGVCRYDAATGKFINVTEAAGIDNGSVTTMLKDRSGNLWIGTELGSGQPGEDGGVWRYDGSTYTKLTTRDGLIHNGVFCIVEDKAGNIWFGTRNMGLCRWDGKTFTHFSE